MKTEGRYVPILAAVAYYLAGPIIWAGHFLFVYGPQSALCAFGKSGVAEVGLPMVSAVVLAVTVLAALPLIAILLWPEATARLLRFNPEHDLAFSIRVTRLLTALSLFGVVGAGVTALMLDPCAQLR